MGTGAKRRESTRRVAPRGVSGVNQISSTCDRDFAAARSSAMADVIGEKSAEVIVLRSRTGRMKEA